jgi:Phage virion morphogenesis family
MSSPGFEIREEGAAKASHDLAELGVRAADVTPAAPAVRLVFAGGERERFDRQGPGWPQLADATRQLKATEGLDRRILRASSRLYDSLVNPASSDAVKTSTPGTIELGTEVFYARFHQSGTTNMPRRVVVELSPAQRTEVAAVLRRWVAHGEALP